MEQNNEESFVPWFGEWPPSFRGEQDKMFENRAKIYLLLIGILLIGILFYYVSTLLEAFFFKIILEAIAIAFMTAAVIGGTIDFALKTEIARDVFKVAFGYILPEEVREELRWIYGLDRMAVRATFEYRIKKIKDLEGKVEMYENATIEIKNISHIDIDFEPHIGIQKWFHPEGESEILNLSYHIGKDRERNEIKKTETNEEGFILRTVKKKVNLGKGKTINITSSIKEIKHTSDQNYTLRGFAIKNPEIFVEIDEGLSYKVSFHTRGKNEQGDVVEFAPNRYKFTGLLLPMQAIRLRWWEKQDATIPTP